MISEKINKSSNERKNKNENANEETVKWLSPKNDYVFKRTFGQSKNANYTKNFIGAITDENISSIKINDERFLERQVMDDKLGIIDLHAVLNENVECDVEMQVVNENNMAERLLSYWGKMYNQGIKKGQDYAEARKTLVIAILNFDLDETKNIPKSVTKWNIREEEFSKFILTDKFEIVILELKKFNKYIDKVKNKDLISWVKFLESPGEIDMKTEKNEYVKEAVNELKELSEDEQEQRIADLREKYILDRNTLRNSGYREGKKENSKEIAKKMKEKSMDVKTISELTGLTKEEIEKL